MDERQFGRRGEELVYGPEGESERYHLFGGGEEQVVNLVRFCDIASLTANVSNRGLRGKVLCLFRFACVYVNATLHVDASLLRCESHF